jgi:adenylate cyclase
MRDDLSKRRQWYQTKFGVFPEFKAGLHCGLVTTGEIGVVKKEIFFTSDVLNATSRIQGLCNTYGVDLLLSGDLLRRLQLPPQIQSTPIGKTVLRGKKETVELFTLSEKLIN